MALENVKPAHGGPLPEVVSEQGVNGKEVARVRDGLAVWEYVLVARELAWEPAAVADHLQEPVERVRAALEHYSRFPDEADARLAELGRFWEDPAKYLAEARAARR